MRPVFEISGQAVKTHDSEKNAYTRFLTRLNKCLASDV